MKETHHFVRLLPMTAVLALIAGFLAIIYSPRAEAGPALTVGPVTVVEGDLWQKSATFSVSITGSHPNTTFTYRTNSGTAVAGSDFVKAEGSKTISRFATKTTISVSVIGDRIYEPDETFTLVLTDGTGATITQAVGTIKNNDTAPVTTTTTATTTGTAPATTTPTTTTVAPTTTTTTVSPSNGNELTVVKKGQGSGKVTSSPAGIDCGTDCSQIYERWYWTGTGGDGVYSVTRTAVPDPGTVFAGWSGYDGVLDTCSGLTCEVYMASSGPRAITAWFAKELTNPVTLTVSIDSNQGSYGAGGGSVTSVPDGIECWTYNYPQAGWGQSGTCAYQFEAGTEVTLTASPYNSGSGYYAFSGWTGPCSGTGTCSVILNADTTVAGTFYDPNA